LGNTGVVKLIDFGVAKATTATQRTATGMIKGKFAYMSPEQIRGQPLDTRSDIFGLGLVLYELLASARAVQGATELELMAGAMRMRFDPIETRRPDIPEELRRVVERSLQKEREARYPSAAAMGADLEAFLTREDRTVSGPELACLLGELAPPVPSSGDDSTPGSDSSKHIPMAAQPTTPPSKRAPSFWESDAVAPTMIDPALAEESALPGAEDAWKVMPPGRPVPPGMRPRGDAPPPSEISRLDTELRPAGPRATPELLPFDMPSHTELRPPSPRPPAPPPRPEPVLAMAESSASLVRKGVRRSTLPWLLSGTVLLAGVALVAFVVLSQPPQPKDPPPHQVAAPKPPEAAPPAPPPVIAVAEPLPPPTPAPRPPSPKVPQPAETATLFVSSVPPMEVWVDDRAKGTTPLQVEVSSGDHTLLLKEEVLGLLHRRTVRLSRGEERREEWRAGKGKVTFRAVPYAEVFLAGRSLGLTPLEPLELWEGSHSFRFFNKDTGRSETREVVVAANQETVLKVDLRAK
ncbi:MAG: serine/threonine protein kinase, partial [Myxococcaceae bacterium]